MSIFEKLSDESLHLNSTEKKIIDEILYRFNDFNKITISMLAEKLYIAPTTIVRLCKKLGYTGFAELKYEIKMENANTITTNEESENNFQNIINQTLRLNSKENIENCAKLMFESKQIVFFALGLSRYVALDLSKKLLSLDKVSIVSTERDACIALANNLNENQLAFFVSLSGNTDIMKKTAYIVKTKNVKVISITGVEQSPVLEASDISLMSFNSKNRIVTADIQSRMGLYLVGELLFDAYCKVYASRQG